MNGSPLPCRQTGWSWLHLVTLTCMHIALDFPEQTAMKWTSPAGRARDVHGVANPAPVFGVFSIADTRHHQHPRAILRAFVCKMIHLWCDSALNTGLAPSSFLVANLARSVACCASKLAHVRSRPAFRRACLRTPALVFACGTVGDTCSARFLSAVWGSCALLGRWGKNSFYQWRGPEKGDKERFDLGRVGCGPKVARVDSWLTVKGGMIGQLPLPHHGTRPTLAPAILAAGGRCQEYIIAPLQQLQIMASREVEVPAFGTRLSTTLRVFPSDRPSLGIFFRQFFWTAPGAALQLTPNCSSDSPPDTPDAPNVQQRSDTSSRWKPDPTRYNIAYIA